MKNHFLKIFMGIAVVGATAYCLKRFSDELVVYVSPDKDAGDKDDWTDF
ncbi:hypothetical protein KG086_00755 [Lacticaseibacillus chiayiensis]|uniref:Uncharacterized protein n=1 Tax=Lacticaseibacillus chiayiensis TaxID=2100821 RepID=A0ABY6H5N9_9LACO|nr:hypothetical protein [Lacticaseibacillus chiayiensis]QVI34913.1 hypothetical protein KG086_00755 [Lacticaseibacillus chiayiensis]UYN56671.1 hypothetical protein OFW50_00760 [Lacticaseibacillus chiayiensis]